MENAPNARHTRDSRPDDDDHTLDARRLRTAEMHLPYIYYREWCSSPASPRFQFPRLRQQPAVSELLAVCSRRLRTALAAVSVRAGLRSLRSGVIVFAGETGYVTRRR